MALRCKRYTNFLRRMCLCAPADGVKIIWKIVENTFCVITGRSDGMDGGTKRNYLFCCHSNANTSIETAHTHIRRIGGRLLLIRKLGTFCHDFEHSIHRIPYRISYLHEFAGRATSVYRLGVPVPCRKQKQWSDDGTRTIYSANVSQHHNAV